MVDKVYVRAKYCMVCGHHAHSHEIAMNTPQSGRCLVETCDCVSLETPTREQLGDQVEELIKFLSEAHGYIRKFASPIIGNCNNKERREMLSYFESIGVKK